MVFPLACGPARELGNARSPHRRKRRWQTGHQLHLRAGLMQQEIEAADRDGARLHRRSGQRSWPGVVNHIQNGQRGRGGGPQQPFGISVGRPGRNSREQQWPAAVLVLAERDQPDPHAQPVSGRDLRGRRARVAL